ncbi:hypothetical protein PG291_10255 [Riemerella anatipestifer]|nr:hypothetical protein [Riemerella anatipestifer]
MKKIIFLSLLFLPFLAFGNMAQPYFDGDNPSTLYGSKECDVLKENIYIKLVEYEDNLYQAKYTIEYFINSEINQSFPLVFYGINLEDVHKVLVNDVPCDFYKSSNNDNRKLYYDKSKSIEVNSNELINFNVNLIKGTNKIILEYTASLGFNTYGFIKKNDILYSLYPSKFWKSFGEINIEISSDKEIDIVSSNIGDYTKEDEKFRWKIKTLEVENIEISISSHISLLSKILLFLQPFGIATIISLLLITLHLWTIKQKYLLNKYPYSLSIGNFLVPLLFYIFLFMSYSLIDFSLGNKGSKHGYIFLLIFTLPFFWLIYGLIMLSIDRMFKNKYN